MLIASTLLGSPQIKIIGWEWVGSKPCLVWMNKGVVESWTFNLDKKFLLIAPPFLPNDSATKPTLTKFIALNADD